MALLYLKFELIKSALFVLYFKGAGLKPAPTISDKQSAFF